MDRTAGWVEVEQDGYLWWSEEWMQLFGAENFVDHGRNRILLIGSSEAREGFLFDEFEPSSGVRGLQQRVLEPHA